jgi:hypothetical protein
MQRYELFPNPSGSGPLEYGIMHGRDQNETQIRYTPQFAGPLRIPPANFQPRVRQEHNARDTANARFIESWNAKMKSQNIIDNSVSKKEVNNKIKDFLQS